jgi:predicted GIY-YIG superfamily endonuclease
MTIMVMRLVSATILQTRQSSATTKIYWMKGQPTSHHSVYIVYLRNPRGDGKAGYYVGMTGLTPEQRFANHKAGTKAARIVKCFGVRLVPKLYAHLNPMTYLEALAMEKQLAEELRGRGFQVFGGT